MVFMTQKYLLCRAGDSESVGNLSAEFPFSKIIASVYIDRVKKQPEAAK